MPESVRTDPPAAAVPPAGGADNVHRWWNSLSPADRERLIAEHPPSLGNLDGIPAAVRGQINIAVLRDDLTQRDDGQRRHNAEQTRQGLEHLRGPDPGNPRPVLLWAYEPRAFAGQGRAAIAIGDPDQAQHIVVVAPGTGSSVAGGWLRAGHNAAINLYDRAAMIRPDDATSVIAWMGYDTPDSFTDRGIAAPALARAGGAQLARDVNGLRATHTGPDSPHVTVIGHSYGATTVADAFAGSGMRADDAILLGSPGTDLARSAADFGLDGGQVYVGSASTDPVSWIGVSGSVPDALNDLLGNPFGPDAGLGADPAGDGFGSVRFRAEAMDPDTWDLSDHSHYYDLAGEAMRAMVLIAIGNGDALAREDLLAQGRRQPRLVTPSEVNIPVIGRIRLPRIDTRIPGTPAYIDPEAARRTSTVEDSGVSPDVV